MTGIDSKRQAALNKLFEVENELGLHYDQRTPMTKDEALKLALEALELSAVTVDSFGVQKKTNEAITAIKEALAQPEQEPVAYWIPRAEQFCIADPSGRPFLKTREPLYTTPPEQEPEPDALTVVYMSGVYEGRKLEREACAKVCESRATPGTGSVAILNGAADAIRARGQA